MKLKPCQEIVGTLIEIKPIADQIKLVFQVRKIVEIPRYVIAREKLEGFIGQQIGIFNYNDNYKVRKIK